MIDSHDTTGLPEFENAAEAEQFWEEQRHYTLIVFEELVTRSAGAFTADYRPESLNDLEKWYIALHEEDRFVDLGVTVEQFQWSVAIYFGEIVRERHGGTWSVHETPPSSGRHLPALVLGRLTVSLNRFRHLAKQSASFDGCYLHDLYLDFSKRGFVHDIMLRRRLRNDPHFESR